MAAEDELTQRERRAQRARSQKRTSTPGGFGRGLRTYGPFVLVALLLVGAVVGVYVWSESGQACPNPHWHATAGIFIPGPTGQPELVDFSSPRTPDGAHNYYDYTSTQVYHGDPNFSLTLHMHQDASSAESGPANVGPFQWHMEHDGVCIGVKAALQVLEISATSNSLDLEGAHHQVPNQSGTFTATGNQTLRWFVQSDDGNCDWAWHEWSWDKVKGHQMQDGESLVVALGHYSDAQVQQMEHQVPAPISRCKAPPPSTTHSSTSSSASSSTTMAATSEGTTSSTTTA